MTPRPPRALWAFACAAIGITAAHHFVLHTALIPLLFAGLCALFACVGPRRLTPWALALATVGVSWGWAHTRWHDTPAHHLSRQIDIEHYERTLVTLEGTLIATPAQQATNRGALGSFARFTDDPFRAELRVDTLVSENERRECAGVVRLRIDGVIDRRGGERVRVTGWFSPVRPPVNPAGFDARLRSAEEGLAGTVSVPNGGLIEYIGPPSTARAHVDTVIGRLRAGAARALPDDGSERSALLRALVLGERSGAYDDLASPFARSGLGHVLAISGMHLGVLAGMGVLFVRLTGDRPRLEALVVVALVVLVLLLVPARAPIVRAGIIAVALAGGALAGRRYHPIAMLALAGLAVLAWRPSDLFSPGFQLSFGVVAALILFTPAVESRWFGPTHDPNTKRLRHRVWEWCRRAIAGSVVASLLSTPIVAYAFGVVAWTAPVSAIVSVPCAGLVLALGYGAVILGLVIPGGAESIGDALLWTAEPLLALVRAIDAVPGTSMQTPMLGAWWAALGTALVLWWCWRGLGVGCLERAAIVGCALGFGVWTYTLARTPTLGRDTALRVDVLALGDGSCWVLRSGDEAMLFDCGSRWSGAGVRAIPDALRALRVPPTARAVVSHPDIDHYACLPDAAERIGVREVLVPERFVDQANEQPRGPAQAFLAEMGTCGVTTTVIARGDAWTIGGARVEVLSPSAGARFDKDNDHAVSLLVTVDTDAGSRCLLLLGDLEQDGLDALRATYPDLRADVVEAPHHGSPRDFAVDFVSTLDARVVVQSTGASRIDPPAWATVRERVRWWTTATHGAVGVTIRTDGSIDVEPTGALTPR